tara:strand:+ start:621 stop:1604 length:984 start_codon:yes stop_codon:yes gene_type:complete
MNNCFLTEGNWEGKIPKEFEGMRNDSAWMHLLNADHHFIGNFENIKNYDNVFIMFPKGHLSLNMVGVKLDNKPSIVTNLLSSDMVNILKSQNKKIHYIQEGPTWVFNDYEIIDQFNFYNLLHSVDTIFAHNKHDVKFYKGLFPNKNISTIPPIMIHHHLKNIIPNPQEKVMVGGNFARWYGGFQSYIVANIFEAEKWAQNSHAQREYEDHIEDLNHFPRLTWLDWMKELSTFKYAIHLMPTIAAGTFSLNCAYFGIPCIGNTKVDTQNICHPDLSVDVDDVEKACALANRLKEDKEFYKSCSETSKIMYKKYYGKDKFINDITPNLI